MSKKKALILTTTQGHASISSAISETLMKNEWNIQEIKYVNNFKALEWLHRNSIWLMRLLSKPLMHPVFLPLEKYILKIYYLEYVKEQILKYNPDVVISTFYLLNPSIEYWKKRSKFVFINMISDPSTFLPINPSEYADVNCVFDEQQEIEIKKIYPNIKTEKIGWITKSIFKNKIDKILLQKKLELELNLPTFLMSSGSLGNQFSSNLIIFLLGQKIPCQIIFIAGSNSKLKKRMINIKKLFPKSKSKLFVFGFVTNIDELMKSSDLIIGKAGPNTLFESVLSLRPFFATNYGGAQEVGNIEIIKKHNLGYSAKNIIDATLILNRILKNPKELNQFNQSLKVMRNYLLESEIRFLKTIDNLL